MKKVDYNYIKNKKNNEVFYKKKKDFIKIISKSFFFIYIFLYLI